MKKKVCLLVSGGYDSAVLLNEFLERGIEVHPLYVRSGFIWEGAEFHWLKRLLKALKKPGLKPLIVVDAPMDGTMKSHWSVTGKGVPGASTPDERVYLPGRNLVLLSLAGIYCASKGIGQAALAVLRANPFPDASPAYLRAMSKAVGLALDFRFSIITPYARRVKAQLARRHGRDFPFELTFSCIRPKGLKPCGRCNKCAERSLMRTRPRS